MNPPLPFLAVLMHVLLLGMVLLLLRPEKPPKVVIGKATGRPMVRTGTTVDARSTLPTRL